MICPCLAMLSKCLAVLWLFYIVEPVMECQEDVDGEMWELKDNNMLKRRG